MFLFWQVGGFDGRFFLRNVEAYNPETDIWLSMLSPRSNFGMAIVEDRLFVVGGISGNGCLSYNLSFQFVVGQYYGKGGSLKAEYYQADTHSWVKIWFEVSKKCPDLLYGVQRSKHVSTQCLMTPLHMYYLKEWIEKLFFFQRVEKQDFMKNKLQHIAPHVPSIYFFTKWLPCFMYIKSKLSFRSVSNSLCGVSHHSYCRFLLAFSLGIIMHRQFFFSSFYRTSRTRRTSVEYVV